MSEEEQAPARRPTGAQRPPAGLCDACAFQRLIHTTSGSSFSMCDRSRTDDAFPRYPRLPVLECAGHEPRPKETEAAEGPP